MNESIKIWGSKCIMLKHFFQIIQTKQLYSNVQEDKYDLVCIVANLTELKLLGEIIKTYTDRGSPPRIYIIYCGFDPLFELCKSQESKNDIEIEMKKLEYEFTCFIEPLEVKFDLNTASNYLSMDKKNATEGLISLKVPANQRSKIVNEMTPASYLGCVEFVHVSDTNSTMNNDIVYFDKPLGCSREFEKIDFVSCVCIPYQ